MQRKPIKIHDSSSVMGISKTHKILYYLISFVTIIIVTIKMYNFDIDIRPALQETKSRFHELQVILEEKFRPVDDLVKLHRLRQILKQ